jgi:hypothetical protein
MKARAFLVPFVLALGCADPIHDEAVDALGPEAPGVEPGPIHRPGQPCLVCHGESGPGEPAFAFAGTTYVAPNDATPLSGVSVQVIGNDLRSRAAVSNCVGNFFVTKDDFDLVYPATTVATGSAAAPMKTLMHRSGDCNSCHRGDPGPDSPGLVWAATGGPASVCP